MREQLGRRLSDGKSATPRLERKSASIGENKAVVARDMPLARMLRNAVDQIGDANNAAHRRVLAKTDTEPPCDLVSRDRVRTAGRMDKQRPSIFRRPSAVLDVLQINLASLDVSRTGDN